LWVSGCVVVISGLGDLVGGLLLVLGGGIGGRLQVGAADQRGGVGWGFEGNLARAGGGGG